MKSTGIVKHFFHRLEYTCLWLFSAIMAAIPESCVYMIARILGGVAYHILRIRRDVTINNLRQALGGELSEAELEKIARRTYSNIGMTFIEVLLIPKLKSRIFEIVDMSDSFILKRNFDKGRGLILVSCHFSNWELNGASVAALGIPVSVVAKKQSNPYVDSYINGYRTGFGMKIIPPGVSIKHVVRALREHEAVGLISDQDAGKRGVFVDFFGRRASTPGGAAQLALKYGAPIVVTMSIRTACGRYKSIFREVEVRENDTVEELTQRFTTIMEEVIRQNPEQYFWMHRRWKTRPPDNASRPGERLSHGY